MVEEQISGEVYDPFDAELQQLKDFGVSDIQPDFSNPQVAKLLIQQLHIRLLELRQYKLKVDSLLDKNTAQRDEAEKVLVRNGRLEERDHISWIEFPAGVLCGIAGNMVVTNRYDFLGWSLLVIGFAFFLMLRFSQITEPISKLLQLLQGKGGKNA